MATAMSALKPIARAVSEIHGSQFARSALIGSISALALTALPIQVQASVLPMVGGSTDESSAFLFGDDKKVWFNPTGCSGTNCESAELLEAPNGLGNPGFRIKFSDSAEQSVRADAPFDASTGGGTATDELGGNPDPQELEFTVMSGPLYEIVGVSLAIGAGVEAEYNWQGNGEDFNIDLSSPADPCCGGAEASVDVDVSLSSGVALSINDFFDVEVSDSTLPGYTVENGEEIPFNDNASDDQSGEKLADGDGGLAANSMHTLTLSWLLTATAGCDVERKPDAVGSLDDLLVSCSARGEGSIDYVDIRFIQQRVGSAPEPGSVALLGAGLAGLGWRRRRKRESNQ